MECSEDSPRLSTAALLLVQNTLYTGFSWVVIRVCHGRSQAVTGRVTAEIPRQYRDRQRQRDREREREHLEVFLSLTSGENLARGTYSGNSSATRATIDKRACQLSLGPGSLSYLMCGCSISGCAYDFLSLKNALRHPVRLSQLLKFNEI